MLLFKDIKKKQNQNGDRSSRHCLHLTVCACVFVRSVVGRGAHGMDKPHAFFKNINIFGLNAVHSTARLLFMAGARTDVDVEHVRNNTNPKPKPNERRQKKQKNIDNKQNRRVGQMQYVRSSQVDYFSGISTISTNATRCKYLKLKIELQYKNSNLSQSNSS